MKFTKYLLIVIVAALACFAAPQAKTTKKADSKTAASAPAATGLIDINSASEQELKQLPGIGDAYAAKIVSNRPYRGKNDLIRKKVIPQATYDKIKDQVIAKQGTAAGAPSGKKE
jgi:DNA uptake protein ComE-like DNA-binding protein